MTPDLRGNIVLLDIDRTIVEATVPGERMIDALHDTVAQRHDIGTAEAKARVAALFDPSEEDPDGYLPKLGIKPVDYRRRLLELFRGNTVVYPDAVAFIHWLKKEGFTLFPATTNGPTAITVKLAAAGLGDIEGRTCFAELFGGSGVCPGGKAGPQFFHALVKRLGVGPDNIVMVGDDPDHDLADAQAAGIRQVIIVDREQTAAWCMMHPPAIHVRALTEAVPFLTRRAP